MSFWEVVSGKVARDNALLRLFVQHAQAELDKLRTGGLTGPRDAFAAALIVAIHEMARYMFCDSKIQGWKDFAMRRDPSSIRRFTSFVAAYLNYRWIRDFLAAKPSDRTAPEDLFAALEAIREALFPLDDPGQQRNVEQFIATEERLGDEEFPLRVLVEHCRIFDRLLGIMELNYEEPADPRSLMERTMMLASNLNAATELFFRTFNAALPAR
jgi:hypothetical protein